VVVRHAQAEAYAASDVERELTPNGREDAAEAGRWLAEQGVVPATAYVSAAVRTRETWSQMAGAAGWSVTPTYDELLYSTDEDGILELLRRTDDAVGTVVVLGHNPTVAVLAQLLDDGDGPAEIAAELAGGYPTCAVTVFDVATSWADLGPMGATPRAFHVGRG